jgi:prepilin-type processing-associated H-X9-DG protein
VTDGFSKTLLGSEIILVPDTAAVNDLRGRYFNNWEGNCLFSTLYLPNSAFADVSNYCIAAPQTPCQLASTGVVQSARSLHPAGANFLWADGSVDFLGDDIAAPVFAAMGTRAGGEVSGTY